MCGEIKATPRFLALRTAATCDHPLVIYRTHKRRNIERRASSHSSVFIAKVHESTGSLGQKLEIVFLIFQFIIFPYPAGTLGPQLITKKRRVIWNKGQ